MNQDDFNQFDHDKILLIKRQLAEHGVNLAGSAVQSRIAKARAQAQAEAELRYPDNRAVNAVITARITKMLGYLAVFFVTAFLVVGNVITIIAFPIAEFMAVRAGIMAFEPHSELATLNAAVVVIGLVSLLFIRNLLRDALPDDLPVPRGSLRRMWHGVRHFVTGEQIGTEPLQSETLYLASAGAVSLLQIVIVLLGFMGRVRDAMTASAANGETYYTFVVQIIANASAVEMIGYIGTIALTLALLKVTDMVVHFIYSVFVSTAGNVQFQADGSEDLRSRFLNVRSATLELEALNDLLIQKQALPPKE